MLHPQTIEFFRDYLRGLVGAGGLPQRVVELSAEHAAGGLNGLLEGFGLAVHPLEFEAVTVPAASGGRKANTARRRRPGLVPQAAGEIPVEINGQPVLHPAQPDTADAVIVLDLLEHDPEPDRTLGSVRASLKPGGVLLMTVATGERKAHAARIGDLKPGEFYRNVTGADLVLWLQQAGLRLKQRRQFTERGEACVIAIRPRPEDED